MNPAYIEFFTAFSSLVAKSRNLSLNDSRAVSTSFFTENTIKEPIHKIINKSIIGPDGNQIPLRIYIPQDGKAVPVLLFFHGGGWVFGSIEDSDDICRHIANSTKCIVISVGYRLAPENPFPKGLDDCYAATKWVTENAMTFGGDPTRVAVSGESAGANLAAAVAMMARDKAELTLKLQLLLYPVTTNEMDAGMYAKSLDQTFITFDAMKIFWRMYLEKAEDGDNPYASPLKARNLENLPPAFIVTAEFDPLHNEAEAYAKRLKEFNVPVTCKRYLGAVHSFLSLPVKELPERKEAFDDIQRTMKNVM